MTIFLFSELIRSINSESFLLGSFKLLRTQAAFKVLKPKPFSTHSFKYIADFHYSIATE